LKVIKFISLTFSLTLWIIFPQFSHAEFFKPLSKPSAPITSPIKNIEIKKLFFQEDVSTHLRWNFNSSKDQWVIEKSNSIVRIQTLNISLFKKVVEDIRKYPMNKKYITSIDYLTDGYPEKPATIKITVKDDSIELFNFYKATDKRYVLDFWVNEEVVKLQKEALAQVKVVPKVLRLKPKKVKKKTKKVVSKKITRSKRPARKLKSIDKGAISLSKISDRTINTGYKDFRYGASFIWDYPALEATLKEDIRLTSKIPAFLYKIKDREYGKDKKEAHMQLSINMYRKEKWGLMAKSISLYEKKYKSNKNDKNRDINEFLKANSLLKKNIVDKNKGLANSAQVILEGILSRSDDYLLKKSIYRYLIQYNRNRKMPIKTLDLAKNFFVLSKKNFDNDYNVFAAKVILESLTKLKQITKIKTFVKDLNEQNILRGQLGIAHLSYAYLKLNDLDKLIKMYEKNKSSLSKPVHPSILYNTAEAYFRASKFKEAIKLFDQFVKTYSHFTKASHARLRIALSYEIQSKEMSKVAILYQNAINRSPQPEVRYEAKLRYIALKMARKRNVTAKDKEAEVFFERSPDESKSMTFELRKLLWLVRLRIFINAQDYEKALAYLNSIPLNGFKIIDQKVFQGDGAEIVYGIIKQHYTAKNFMETVKIWEVFKDKYEQKVAKNPYMNFIVCDSYIKLGLYRSFNRSLAVLKSLKGKVHRSFPVWVRRKSYDVKNMISELNIIKFIAAKDWQKAGNQLDYLEKRNHRLVKTDYYRGLLSFKQSDFKDSSNYFEKVLTTAKIKNSLNKSELTDTVIYYIESLYKNNNEKKFAKAAKALIKDIRKVKNDKILKVAYERVSYLYIEYLSASPKANFTALMGLTNRFIKEFDKSEYKWRVSYLRGVSFVNGIDIEKGRKQFQKLIENKDVPKNIKGLARAELSAIELSNNL
jgi:hypothetical protein